MMQSLAYPMPVFLALQNAQYVLVWTCSIHFIFQLWSIIFLLMLTTQVQVVGLTCRVNSIYNPAWLTGTSNRFGTEGIH